MKPFIYSIDGHAYKLVVEYTTSGTGRVWVVGCEMYNMKDQYLGYWYRYNMPAPVLRDATRHAKRLNAETPLRLSRNRTSLGNQR